MTLLKKHAGRRAYAAAAGCKCNRYSCGASRSRTLALNCRRIDVPHCIKQVVSAWQLGSWVSFYYLHRPRSLYTLDPTALALALRHCHSGYGVMLSRTLDDTPLQQDSCYFSIVPPVYSSHYSVETPATSPTCGPGETASDPFHPLLAFRDPLALASPISPRYNHANIMQLQSKAAHGAAPSTRPRPKPYPVQNVLQVTSDDSASSGSDTSDDSSASITLALMRCSRCQRTPSVDIKTGKSNMIQYGLNSFYCTRCAAMVGYTGR